MKDCLNILQYFDYEIIKLCGFLCFRVPACQSSAAGRFVARCFATKSPTCLPILWPVGGRQEHKIPRNNQFCKGQEIIIL